MSDPSTQSSEQDAFDKTARKGKPHHLFQESLKSIRKAHFRSNRIRAGLIVTGLFTDVQIYREVIAVFYAVTRALEQQLEACNEKNDEPICQALLSLGYGFAEEYSKDLAFLYDESSWKQQVQAVVDRTPAAKQYLGQVEHMSRATELAGAACVLWGALVVGGGAAAMPRVRSLCGPGATHIFQQVTGPGREDRKRTFISVWDSLAEPGTPEFDEILSVTQECMQCNNDVLSTLQRNPWWLNYVIAISVGIALYFLYFVYGSTLLPSEAESREL